MEKRFVLFIVLSLATLTGYALIKNVLDPQPPAVAERDVTEEGSQSDETDSIAGDPGANGASAGEAGGEPDDDTAGTTDPQEPSPPAATGEDNTGDSPSPNGTVGQAPGTPDAPPNADGSPEPEPTTWPARWISAGSYLPGGPAGQGDGAVPRPVSEPPILITWNARGGCVERIELTERDSSGKLRYRELLDRSGYLGHLAPTRVEATAELAGGCRVNVVGAGTPAALATNAAAPQTPGLQIGDVIYAVDGEPIASPRDLKRVLGRTKPKQAVRLSIRRPATSSTAAATELQLTATLGVHPLQLIQPERPFNADPTVPLHPSSFLLSLLEVDERKAAKGTRELKLDRSLRNDNWQLEPTADGRGVEFRLQVTAAAADGSPIKLEVLKRFRLGRPTAEDPNSPPYHLDYDIEIKNLSSQPHRIAYRQDGPNGLPLEGFWYSNKLHPDLFYVAGARDIVWKKQIRNGSEVVKTNDHDLISCSELYKTASKAIDKDKSPEEILFDTNEDNGGDPMPLYVAVDTQYFVSALVPVGGDQMVYRQAAAYVLGDLSDIPKAAKKSTNVSFHLDSESFSLPAFDPNQADASFKQSFEIYAGPKIPELLAEYDLQDCIYYGWFAAVSRLLAVVLHFFFAMVKNYGVAIIMLTILVRGGMFPLSRKAAKNAAMMQALAPQMKKITEKYKEDMEKRAKAQQDLFKKHNYNPFGGCWMMFLQLPIFIGLYRTLSVDIDLRQAALIPGIQWCSNLAGPDMLFVWPEMLSWSLFTELGMLGPYFNILPMFTVALFLVQQKLFTPPPTDDQSRMQLTMMKYMTVFIGVMFFKVAAGLCIYFIASSLWGIAERKLLPKPKLAGDGGSDPEPLAAKPKPKPKRPRPKIPDNGKSGRQQPQSNKKKRR